MSIFSNVVPEQKLFHDEPAENDYKETIQNWFTEENYNSH